MKKKSVCQFEEETQFKYIPQSLRVYKPAKDNAPLLQQFQWHSRKASTCKGPDLKVQMNKEAFFEFPSYELEQCNNKRKLVESNSYTPITKLVSIPQGHAQKRSSDKAWECHQFFTFAKMPK